MRFHRLRALLLALGAALALSACLGQLDASSSCRDFLHASRAQQDDAISKVASDLQSSNAAGPLGPPAIRYDCATSPDMTLGEAVRRIR